MGLQAESAGVTPQSRRSAEPAPLSGAPICRASGGGVHTAAYSAEETDMKSEFYTGYNAELKDRSRQLRKNMTRQERHLWYDFLRDYPIKIYRQRSIDRFIADFYCSRAHIVIEVDGGQHYESNGLARDAERSAIIQNYNLAVVRVSNAEVDQNFFGVCEFIDRRIKEELSKWED